MSKPSVVTRFAPSPTGFLHLGNARTALFAFLAARASGGRFLLRIEDTDAARGHEKFTQALIEDLSWLGLSWDEGPDVGGPKAPYAQSERGAIYASHFEALRLRSQAYPCFCTEHELAIERRAAMQSGRPPRYSGRCRDLSPADVAQHFFEGRPATLRFRVPEDRKIAFSDRVRGPQEFRSDDIGDFVIRRSDGTPAFFFSNGVDDAEMGVTLVLRGEDHLANTPRQILLLEALGLRIPEYGHLALVVGNDARPLSKREGAQSLRDLRAQGYLPAAIANYLARLGHTLESDECLGLPSLAAHFSPDRLHRAPARFDVLQLHHYQHLAVRTMSVPELHAWMQPALPVALPHERGEVLAGLVRDNVLFPGDAAKLAARFLEDPVTLETEARSALEAVPAGFFDTAADLMREARDFRAFTQSLGAATGLKGRALFHPLRAALTGALDGPELQRVVEFLGWERAAARLRVAAR